MDIHQKFHDADAGLYNELRRLSLRYMCGVVDVGSPLLVGVRQDPCMDDVIA